MLNHFTPSYNRQENMHWDWKVISAVSINVCGFVFFLRRQTAGNLGPVKAQGICFFSGKVASDLEGH